MLITEKKLRILIMQELLREEFKKQEIIEEGYFANVLKSAALTAGVALGSFSGGGAYAKPSGGVKTFEMNREFLYLYDKVIDRLEKEGVDIKNMQLFKKISSELFVGHDMEQGLYEFLKICFKVVDETGYDAFMLNIDTVRELGKKIIEKHKKEKSVSGGVKSGESEVWMGTIRKKGERMPARWNVKK